MGFPDVCLTPSPVGPVPIPYPNIAMGPTAVGAAYTVLLGAMPAHNMSTQIPLTNGDNAGVATGVASGMVMGPSRSLTASFTVLMGGSPNLAFPAAILAGAAVAFLVGLFAV